jgi:DNA-binding response OmpR family regulator
MVQKKIKVLIVEDEKSLTKALSAKLGREGFEVMVAHDGQEGLALASEERPDVILLDIIMPKMDGLSMIKELRKMDSYGKRVKVIFLTNLTDDEKIFEATESGVYDYLIKSDWKLADLVEKINEKVNMHAKLDK